MDNPTTSVFVVDEPTRAALVILADADSFEIKDQKIRMPPYLRDVLRGLSSNKPRVPEKAGEALRRAVNALEVANELLRTEADADDEDCEDAKEAVREARAALADLGVPAGLFFCTDDGIEQLVVVGSGPLSSAMPKMHLNPDLSWEMRDDQGQVLDMARSAADCGLSEGSRVFVASRNS